MAENKILFEVEIDDKNSVVKLKSLEKEFKDIDLSAKSAANSASKVTSELKKLGGGKIPKSVKLTTKEISALNKELSKASGASGATTSSVLELGRVISDAPYGIRGMANNLTQLVSQMAFATKASGGFINALKGVWSAMMGPLGVVLAITAVISLIDGLYGANKKAEKSTDDLNDSLNKQVKTLTRYKELLNDTSNTLEQTNGLINAVALSDKNFNKILQKTTGDLESRIIALRNYIQSKEDELAIKNKINRLDEVNKIIREAEITDVDVLNKKLHNLKIAYNAALKSTKDYATFSAVRYGKEISDIEVLLDAMKDQKSIMEDLSDMQVDDSFVKGSLDDLKSQLSIQKKHREATSRTKTEYEALTIKIKSLKKEIEEIEGVSKKANKTPKFSPFKTKKELQIELKDNERAILTLQSKIEQENLKIKMNEELSTAETEEEKKKIRERYRKDLLISQINLERKRMELAKDTEISIAKNKTNNHILDLKRLYEKYLLELDLNNKISDKEKERLKSDATGKFTDSLLQASAEGDGAISEIEERYKPLKNLFDSLADSRLRALIGGFNDEEKEKELAVLQDYINSFKDVFSGLSSFLSAEYDREITIEQNKTNALNEQLNNRLLNEQLSKDERAKIQNQIYQNDEKLRKKQESIARKKFETDKAFNISSAIIDTYAGASKALAQDGVFGIVSGAAIIARGLLNVAQISRQKFQSSSAATPINTGSSSDGGGDDLGDRSFNFNLVGNTETNQLLQALQSQFEQPIQAFVVSKDITTQQELDANIQGQARI